jgi:hypothetical protein
MNVFKANRACARDTGQPKPVKFGWLGELRVDPSR